MDIQLTNGIIGVTCLAFAAIGTFLLVPDRELTVRERIGIHTIFWTFILYAMWIIYTLAGMGQGWEKYFLLGFPLLLGLLLSLLSELNSRQPLFNIAVPRINKITQDTWNKLPNNVKRGLQKTVMNVQSIPEWSALDMESLKLAKIKAARWFPILPFPARGIIHISAKDCEGLPSPVITGTLAHEFALAYQSTRTPFDSEAVNRAGEELPIKWGFKKEIAALKAQSPTGA
ncbi:MAG: hypothetical protein ABSF74_08025 [Dehalococcoidia bacterium]|jgi:hypothetical protein